MPSRGPYSKSAQTREQILDAALRIIGENGYTGATLQQIADAVEMSKPGVLHHFGSRDALLTAILERRDMRDTAAHASDQYVVENLIETVRHNMTVPGLVALYTALTGSAATEVGSTTSRAYFTDRYRRVLVTLTEAVRIAQSEGLVKAEHNPATIARLLVAASDGLQTQWLLNPRVDMAADLEALWRLVLQSE